MNAKHLFLTLTMLLASLTFAWGGTVVDDFSESAFASEYTLTKTTRKEFSGFDLTSSAVYAGYIRWNKDNYLIFNSGDPSRIASTTSGGILTQVSVTWYGTNTDYSILVYGSNTAYTGSETPTTLEADPSSELLATITYPNTASTDFSAKGYHYVAVVGDATLNVTDVNVTWTEEVSYNVKMDAGYDSDMGAVTINGVDATAGATVTTAKAGDVITIEVTPELDYCLTGFTFGDMEFDLSCIGYLEEEETGTYKIIMPEIAGTNITLTPAFDDMPVKTPQKITIKDGSTPLSPSTPVEIQSGVSQTFNYELKYNRSSDPAYDGIVTITSQNTSVFAVTSYTQPDDDGKGTFTIKGFTGTAKVEIQTQKSIHYYAGDALQNITVSPREVVLVAEASDGKFYAMDNTVTDGKANGIKVVKSGDYYYYDPSELTLANITWNVMTTSVDDDKFAIMKPSTSNYLRLPASKLLLGADSFEWWKDANDFFVNPTSWGPNYGGSNFAAALTPSYGVVEALIGSNFIPFGSYSTVSGAVINDVRTLTEGGYGTFCSPYDVPDVSTAGAKFYSLTGKVLNGDKTQLAGIVLSEDPETELVAGHSYFYQVDAGSSAINLTGCMNHVTHAWENGADGFVGCLVDDNGGKTYVPDGVERINGNYILQSGKLRYVAAGTTASIRAYRAYINVGELEDVDAKSVPKRRIVRAEGFEGELGMEDTATGIDELAENNVINWNEPVYNIMGMRVGKGATGVLIQNGRKFFVK